jgi:homoserine kinase
LLARLTKAGALVSCWSGAGPSLLGICDGQSVAAHVRDAGELALESLGVPGQAMVIAPDLDGLVVGA